MKRCWWCEIRLRWWQTPRGYCEFCKGAINDIRVVSSPGGKGCRRDFDRSRPVSEQREP